MALPTLRDCSRARTSECASCVLAALPRRNAACRCLWPRFAAVCRCDDASEAHKHTPDTEAQEVV